MVKSSLKFYLFAAVIAVMAAMATFFYMKHSVFSALKSDNATVVLEKMKTVTKLIAVEGNFSELYHHKTYYEYDFLNLFQKKIILRVNAKVSVGYDFENVNISIDSLNKTVTLNDWPQPEVLSIDHDIDYFDIKEGVFASFAPEEYTDISRKAKKIIEDKAQATSLFKKAEEQKNNYIKMLEMALKSGGWQLVIHEKLLKG